MKKRSKRERSEIALINAKRASAAEETAAVIPNTASDSIGFRGECLVVFLLVVAVLIPYGQVLGFGFVDYDDSLYVTETPQVMEGLNAKTLAWAFTTNAAHYFHPLTWMSHMLDCQIYGLNAGGHHFTSLLIHAINTVLLFWVLRRMTGLLWASAFTAALFGVHPLHVESVAWVAERKDVLSALFWFAGMAAYARYVRVRSIPSYLLVVAMFILAIMSKPMVVTFPCALLLLDYWPLNRFGDLKPGREWFMRALRLIVEKAPLFALCLASAVSTMIMQQGGSSLSQNNEIVKLPDRIANAFVAYAVYIGKTIGPFHLAPFYPHPGARPFWQTGLALLVLFCITLPVVAAWRKRPYLIVGWLWFVGTLVPVIELVQAGDFAYADRYTYIPSVGLSIMLFYGVADLVQSGRLPKRIFVGVGTVWVAALMICSIFQAHLWRDTFSLFNHALQVTSPSYVAHNGLGIILLKQGRLDEAKAHFLKTLEIRPDYVEAHNNLGCILLDQKDFDEAKVHFLKVLELQPNYVKSHQGLGIVLLRQGHFDEAKDHFLKVLELQPGSAEAYYYLGLVLLKQGSIDEAKVHFLKTLELQPDDVEAHNDLGCILLDQKDFDEAKVHFLKALELKPDFAKAHQGLGAVLMGQGHLDEAKARFLKSLELQPDSADTYYGLGVVLAKQGHFEEAKAHFLKAIELQPDLFGAHNYLGMILLDQGNLDEAKAHFLKALESQPNSVEAHNNLGMVLVNQGVPDEAKVHFLKAIELQPDSAKAYHGLGAVLVNQGSIEEAKVNFLKAIELQPDYAEAYQGLGAALANQGRLDEAKAYFLKAIELDPAFVNAHVKLGVILKHQGLLDEAKAHFLKALEIKPDSSAARKNLDEMR